MPYPTRRALRSSLVATLAAALAAVSITLPPRAHAATGDGSPTDPNISFTGRWDTADPTAYTPHWAGAYLTTGFTGTTVKLKQRNTIDLYASIDGGPYTYYTNVSGTVNLTPTPLRAGTHTLRVSYRVVAGSYHGDAVFRGLVLDSGAGTVAPPVPRALIEFVGDSITVGTTTSKNALTAYGWLIGERLGARHTQIAQGGACLVATADGCVGLERQFVKLDPNTSTPDWDFSRYTADAVVINLGTNDSGHGVHTPEFQTSYTNLLRQVRAKYPKAAVFALETFSKRFAAQTQAAVKTLNDGGDADVYYVNTEGWLTSAQLSDSVHPNDAGHQAIADRLTPIISAKLGGSPSPSPSPTPSPSPSPTPSPSPSPTPSPTPSPSPSPTPSPSPSPTPTPTAAGSCTVTYTITNQWQGGFQGDVTIANTGSAAVGGWRLTWSFPNGQQISQAWNGAYSQSGSAVTVTDAGWNAAIPAGGTAAFGFIASQSGANGEPTAFALNGMPCAVR
ncbi:cellulose binding domain-containing protein [Microbispora bryophytorum]|uniref:cellulose binding domain-containing protein n=1 Tax=Microbispora bryophytorum TaxID=1460882 RepID=UPI0033FBD77E